MSKKTTLNNRKVIKHAKQLNRYQDKYLFSELQNYIMRAAIINLSDTLHQVVHGKKGTMEQRVAQFNAALIATFKTVERSPDLV